jgi:hypothetical protein
MPDVYQSQALQSLKAAEAYQKRQLAGDIGVLRRRVEDGRVTPAEGHAKAERMLQLMMEVTKLAYE